MKKYIRLLGLMLAAWLCLGCAAVPGESPLTLGSQSVLLMEAQTGQVLLEKNADAPKNAAGAVKVMTMLLVFEALEEGRFALSDSIQVSQVAATQPGTRAFLDCDNKYKAEDLVRALCMASANDAAVALAEQLFGSQESFVAKMNERVTQLGLTATRFTDCTGLDQSAVTTARELAIIASALNKVPMVFAYTSVYMHTMTHQTGRVTELVNANRLVRTFANCDGLATGSSATAQYAGVFSAKRGDMRLIAVVLGAQNSNVRFDDAKDVLTYGFANYQTRVIVRKGEVLAKDLPVKGGRPDKVDVICDRDIRLLLERGEEKNVRKEIELDQSLTAPVPVGQQVGQLHIYVGDLLMQSVPVFAGNSSEKLSWHEFFKLLVRRWVMG